MDYLSFVLCLLLASVAIHLLLSNVKKDSNSNPRRLPPGPPALPIIGNLFNLSTNPHITMTELAKRYGPLMTLKLGSMKLVIITSPSIAKEALQKNDHAFCHRYTIDAVCALDHHHKSVIWLQPTAEWRNLRKICNSQVFSTSRLDASQSLRRNKVNDLLSYVQKCSESGVAVDIGQAAFTTSLNLLSNTFFSMDFGDPNSEVSHEFKETVRGVMVELGKQNLADYFPFLKRIDPQGVRQRMSIHFKKMTDLFNSIINQRLHSNKPSKGNDVLDSLLGINQEERQDIEPSNIPALLMDLFNAGTDTTSSTLEWAMAELLKNPEKLKKAQKELRDSIGKENPVQESDMTRLPYLQAVVKETLRLHPPAPLLVPRKANSDVLLLSGFTVPENAKVVVNVWGIGRDPDNWDRPNTFEPERFLGLEMDVKGRDFELIPFGAGRRICPGLPLAMRMLHLMLGSLIHGFDWVLEGGVSPEKMDMEENFALTLEKAQRLRAIPVGFSV